jgi:hypothetical protein
MYRPVPLSIYYAQNPKGFSSGVLELVGSIAGNMDGVVGPDGMQLVPKPDSAGAGKDDDAMLMLVLLEGGEATRFHFKAPHLKVGLRIGHQVESGHRFPRARKVLVLLGLNPFPILALPTLNQENITIAFKISPLFIA